MRGRHTWLRALVVALASLAVLTGTAAASTTHTTTSHGALTAQLKKVKAALAKYRSVDAAKADGYVATGPCQMTPASAGASWWAGAMGVHFVNDALTRQAPNPLKPAILVYLPTASGGFQLAAAEYFKADADQNLKTDADRPTLFGRAFDGPMKGHAPGMPIHYDLHVWLWKHNPSGTFAPFNPDASCAP
jgi:hypothetical protein